MINQETRPNVDLLTYEMIFRHPWLELELNNVSTPAPTSPDPVPAQGVGTHVTLEQMNLLTSQKVQGYNMTCGLPGPAESARFVTVSQINGAVGGYFTLKRLF